MKTGNFNCDEYSFDVGNAIAIDSVSRIVVVEYSKRTTNNDDMVLWRYR